MIAKPPSIAADEFKSAKWDEIVSSRAFDESHVPTLCLLVQWHAIFQRCIEDMEDMNGQVAYMSESGDLKSIPQIGTMHQASAEIRQLSKQLGLVGAAEEKEAKGGKPTVLTLVTSRREERLPRASSSRR